MLSLSLDRLRVIPFPGRPHVAFGEQDEAKEMLKINPELLLHKGDVTDYSNRTFKGITAFQYALWALDWHMWMMIKKYLPDDVAAAQLSDQQPNKPLKLYKKHRKQRAAHHFHQDLQRQHHKDQLHHHVVMQPLQQ